MSPYRPPSPHTDYERPSSAQTSAPTRVAYRPPSRHLPIKPLPAPPEQATEKDAAEAALNDAAKAFRDAGGNRREAQIICEKKAAVAEAYGDAEAAKHHHAAAKLLDPPAK